MIQGFVDLRPGHDGSRGGDNFWPSFTDIMMVVVMIFLITSMVVVLRNWELVSELRATIEAEQRAAEIARSATAQSATLEEQLAYAEEQLSVLRMMLMQASERDERQGALLADRERRLAEIEQQLGAVTARLGLSEQRISELTSDLEQSRARTAQTEASLAAQTETLEETRTRLAESQTRVAEQDSELTRLRQVEGLSARQLSALQDEYDVLKGKYDKLVRPARTASGKYVVEVRYRKRGEEYQIGLKDAGAEQYARLSRAEMDARLAALKEAHPGRLYVKIIIPSDSGLSYTEAWQFTKHVLESYDYYYQ
jgi:chromosome segregation ATPase